MDKIVCKYHPLIPARWACAPCQINFCPACVKTAGSQEPSCAVCNSTLASLAGNAITPFWQRIPRFYLYPINPSALIYMLILSVATSLFADPGLFSVLMQLVVSALFVRYAYEVLELTSAGHPEPPKLSFELINEGLELPFQQFLILVIIAILLRWVFNNLGDIIGVPLALVVALGIPASVMVLATERSLFKAINPSMLWSVITAIGWPYLALYVFLIMLLGGGILLQNMLYEKIPDALYIPIVSFIGMYFTLIMFNMMGYVIYQYHEELGYHVDMDFDEADEPSAKKIGQTTRPQFDEVAILLQEGKIPEAQERLRENIIRDKDNLALHEQYHKLLKVTQNTPLLLEHGREYITALLNQEKLLQATAVVRDCRQADPEFTPAQPEQVYKLASQLRSSRDPKLALSLANNFHKNYPGHCDIPQLYLLVAKILCEDMEQDEQAKKVLHYLLAKYPYHPMQKEISDYLELAERLS